VHAWQLLAGAHAADGLRPVASARAHGFETVLHTDAGGPHFAVRALDAHGAELGTSRAATLVPTTRL
jgi:hypothetical protein